MEGVNQTFSHQSLLNYDTVFSKRWKHFLSCRICPEYLGLEDDNPADYSNYIYHEQSGILFFQASFTFVARDQIYKALYH